MLAIMREYEEWVARLGECGRKSDKMKYIYIKEELSYFE
jgi:hypothetical protein